MPPTVALNLYEIISFVTLLAIVLPAVGSLGVVVEALSSTVFLVLVVANWA